MNQNDLDQKYRLLVKNSRDRIVQGMPIGMYLVMLVFTIVFEIASVDFQVALFLRADFWMRTAVSYGILIAVFTVMFPYFKQIGLEKERSLTVKQNAQEAAEYIVSNRLTHEYKLYTRKAMDELERQYFLDLLNDCGNADPKYLGYKLGELRDEYRNGNINKYQYRLLRAIRSGKMSFSKLTGDEIKYVGSYEVQKNRRYSNQQAEIVGRKMATKFLTMLVIAVMMELIINAVTNDEGEFDFSITDKKAVVTTITTLMKYATSTWFAYSTGLKASEEQTRFTEAVTLFTNEYIETIKKEEEDGNRIGAAEEAAEGKLRERDGEGILRQGNAEPGILQG